MKPLTKLQWLRLAMLNKRAKEHFIIAQQFENAAYFRATQKCAEELSGLVPAMPSVSAQIEPRWSRVQWLTTTPAGDDNFKGALRRATALELKQALDQKLTKTARAAIREQLKRIALA